MMEYLTGKGEMDEFGVIEYLIEIRSELQRYDSNLGPLF